mgnify:CR=1 FL=1
MAKAKRHTVVDADGRPVAEAGRLDAALWKHTIRRSGTPLRVERTDLCAACGLHRCGGGPCAEK